MHKKRVAVVVGAAKGIGHEVVELPTTSRAMGVIGSTRVLGGGTILTAD